MQELVDDIAEAIKFVDQSGTPFKNFQPGVGPYGEPQLVSLIAKHLSAKSGGPYAGARTCRDPDVLIPHRWALEFKIVRPFGDNGIEAEHWSQNLLHPYLGNVSAIGDALKLASREGSERRGIVAICYEHEPPKIDLSILVRAFELISRQLLGLQLGERYSKTLTGLIHPVHQRASVHGWPLD
jgi:hypothetical protein